MNTTLENASPIEKLFDLDMINKFCRGDINLTKKMIQVFIKDIPISVEEIKQAYRESDFIKMKKTAHRIKPVLSMYSIVKVGKEIEVLEMIDQEDIQTAETELKINKLDNIINLVTQQMTTYIS